MKLILTLFAFMVLLSGCAEYVQHTKYCIPHKDLGYQTCHHQVRYVTEPACIGSCQVKK